MRRGGKEEEDARDERKTLSINAEIDRTQIHVKVANFESVPSRHCAYSLSFTTPILEES